MQFYFIFLLHLSEMSNIAENLPWHQFAWISYLTLTYYEHMKYTKAI